MLLSKNKMRKLLRRFRRRTELRVPTDDEIDRIILDIYRGFDLTKIDDPRLRARLSCLRAGPTEHLSLDAWVDHHAA